MKSNDFAKRLKEEREKRGWTQEYIANILEITIPTYSGYERNYRTPDLEMTMKIANVMGVSVDYLLGRTEDEQVPWWEKASPPPVVDLDTFIQKQPNLRLFGDPMNEEVKDDLMMVLRAAWEVVKNKNSRKDK